MRRTLRSWPLAHLAVLAMLLLALLPTTGRLYRSANGDGRAMAALSADSGFGAICSARGLIVDAALAAREAAAFGAIHPTDASDGDAPAPHDGDDCEYCSLSASTAFATTFAFLSHAKPADAPVPRIFDDGFSSSFVHGLGARGPPNG